MQSWYVVLKVSFLVSETVVCSRQNIHVFFKESYRSYHVLVLGLLVHKLVFESSKIRLVLTCLHSKLTCLFLFTTQQFLSLLDFPVDNWLRMLALRVDFLLNACFSIITKEVVLFLNCQTCNLPQLVELSDASQFFRSVWFHPSFSPKFPDSVYSREFTTLTAFAASSSAHQGH